MSIGIPKGHTPAIDKMTLAKKIIPHLQEIDEATKNIWHQARCEVAVGYPVNQVIQIAKENNPYLMVVEGASKLTTFNEWFGTRETTVAEGTDCPVLIIQPKIKWQPIKRILYLIDMDDDKSETVSYTHLTLPTIYSV